MKRELLVLLVFLIISLLRIECRIFSSSSPNSYKNGTVIPIQMNKIQSELVSYPYYYESLYPEPESTKLDESFIFKLSGNRKLKSLYEIKALQNLICKTLINTTTLNSTLDLNISKDKTNSFINLIKSNFRTYFYIDNLPIGVLFNEIYLGFPIGFINNEKYYLYNHFDIKIQYSSHVDGEVTNENSNSSINASTEFYIIQVSISPQSISYTNISSDVIIKEECLSDLTQALELKSDTVTPLVLWTYSITFENSKTGVWHDRWAIYYTKSEDALETSSVVIGSIIILVLSLGVSLIFIRIYKKSPYGLLGPDDSGWKAIYADVFRSPNNFMTFSVIIGFGIHIVVAVFILMIFAVGGFLSIANPGGMVFAGILVLCCTSLFNGYSSMRIYMMLGGTRKKHNSIVSALLLPSITLIVLMIAYFQVWANHYIYGPSGATVTLIIVLFIFLATPLSFLSSHFVKNWPPPGYPCHTNHIPRLIPPTKWYNGTLLRSLLNGVIPFVVIQFQLSIWLLGFIKNEHFNFSYGFCTSLILMIISIIEISIISEYYQLSLENYNWWWRSLIGPSTTGIYVFIYFIIFGIKNITLSGTWFYYFMISLIVSILVGFFCSSIGFLSNFWFIKKIYSTLHFE